MNDSLLLCSWWRSRFVLLNTTRRLTEPVQDVLRTSPSYESWADATGFPISGLVLLEQQGRQIIGSGTILSEADMILYRASIAKLFPWSAQGLSDLQNPNLYPVNIYATEQLESAGVDEQPTSV